MNDFFERYAERILPLPSGCWEWQGSHTVGGYGNLTRDKHSHYAHRAAYEAVHGAGSAAYQVIRHSCDNPPCCNPLHLLAGTAKDNARDAKERGRLNPVRGEASGRAKLTAADVTAMREAVRSGASISSLAQEHQLSVSAANAAVTGQSWGHLDAPPVVPGRQRGEARWNTRLTPETVAAIRAARTRQVDEVAGEFGISRSAVYAIWSRRNWRHVA